MSNSVLLLMFGIMSALMLASPVNMIPVQSDSGNSSNVNTTTAPNHEHSTLAQYTAMLQQLVEAMQTIQTLLEKHVRIVLIFTIVYT